MRILLVADVPNWAWDRKANYIIKYLKKDVDKIDKTYSNRFNSTYFNSYDRIHFFGWREANIYIDKITTGVSSYTFCTRHRHTSKSKLKKFKALAAVSKLLYEKLVKEKFNENIFCLPNGVDHTVFYPKPNRNENNFVVGWVGQPTHGPINLNTTDVIDQHGYTNILLPVIKKFRDHKNIIIKKVARTWKDAISHEDLMSFYNSCDMVIHPGFLTGTPNPIFEASSCGVPVVCTKIGAAVDMIKDGVNGFLIDRYTNEQEALKTIDKFVEIIKKMSEDKYTCKKMGIAGRKIIEQDWTWEKRSKDYLSFFKAAS